jgi:hypothetical protein
MPSAILPPWASRLADQCTDADYERFQLQLGLDIDAKPPTVVAQSQSQSKPKPKPTVKATTAAAPKSAAAQLRSARAKADRDKWEVPFLAQLRTLRFPEPVRNYRFGAEAAGWDIDGNNVGKGNFKDLLLSSGLRDWRMDFAWPTLRMAVEIEGAPGHGRHTSTKGFTADCVKYGEAQALGWTLLRFTGGQVRNGYAINLTYRIFKNLGILKIPGGARSG